jgi:hypothetical protein
VSFTTLMLSARDASCSALRDAACKCAEDRAASKDSACVLVRDAVVAEKKRR